MRNSSKKPDPTYEDVEGGISWNLWERRLPPFNELESGDTVFLACKDGHGGSAIWAVADIDLVVAARYESKSQAGDAMHEAFPDLTKRDFLADEYTIKRPDSGWLLGWSYGPSRPVGVPRPMELVLNRNGWLSLSDVSASQLRRWRLSGSNSNDKPRPPSGTPRRTDALKKVAVEEQAMKVAKRHLSQTYGWLSKEIHNTSSNRPYDFEYRSGKTTVRIEVKGLSGKLGRVALTRREVENAKTFDPVILVVVSEIRLVPNGRNDFKGQGGTIDIWDPWHVDDGTLVPSAFDYQPPAQ
jgi:hypothetical protein